MSLKPTSGRSGLDQIDVTPAVFLQLRAQLTAGKNLPFNEPQLLIAFSRYLHNNKGRWTRSQIKGTRELHKFAEKYVAQETHTLNKLVRPNNNQPQTAGQVSAKQKKAEKFIQDRGLKLLGEKDFPQGTKQHGNNEILGKDTIKRGVDTTEIVTELFTIARTADPAIAVAAILLSRSLLPNFSSMAIDGTYVLLDKFENRAKTNQEKDIVLHGLEEVTAGLSPTLYSHDMLRLQEKEQQLPDAIPEHLKRFEKMRGASEIKAEQTAKEKRHEQEISQKDKKPATGKSTAAHVSTLPVSTLDAYRENMMHMDVHSAAHSPTQKAVNTSSPFGGSWDHRKGPKPPTDEIFGTRHDNEDEKNS